MSLTGYKFVAMNVPTGLKTLVYRMQPAPERSEPLRSGGDRQPTNGGGASVAVHPAEMLGRHFEVSLSLGTDEQADDLHMEEAVISITKKKEIIKTPLVGMKGTVKEYTCDGDYDLTITVGLVAVDANGAIIDEYPEHRLKALHYLLECDEALYVNSEFLRLFGITRLVVNSYTIGQATQSNHQIVSITATSDEDYIIKNNVI